MYKAPILILASLVLLNLGCAVKENIDGFYFGRIESENNDIPVLISFQNNDYKDYFSLPYDSFNYVRKGNIFKLVSKTNNKEYDINIVQGKNELTYGGPYNKDIKLQLKKSKASNFMFDYLLDTEFEVELPAGKGTKRSYGYEHRFKNPMYFKKTKGKSVVHYKDSTIELSGNFYKYLLTTISKYSESIYFPITLIAEKNLKQNEINCLIEQLRLAGFAKIEYVISTSEYDKISTISRVLPPFTETEMESYKANGINIFHLPPAPNVYYSKIESLLIELGHQQIVYLGEKVTQNKFQELIRQNIQNRSKPVIIFCISEDALYQDFITFNTLLIDAYSDARDSLLMNRYNSKFRGLNASDPKYHEAINQIPMIIIEDNPSRK